MARFILRCGCVFDTEETAFGPQPKPIKLKSGDPRAAEIAREIQAMHDANPEACVRLR